MTCGMTVHIILIFRWCRELQRRNVNMEDAERIGRPRAGIREENVTDAKKMLDENR